ncbi:L-asparaginase [Saccharothrix tamanrassetensis]|uniref:asparaginase n=1 Tax=Saccharothrix tamanrassetensis TaxID=1051531 RepID=A0A841CMB9_9PSEU|nr:asparaginase [Saccharothrix tamanrassetensis]MBB5957237.1 L-asparaginase [Saccharothrix tamanrassetensis]
MAHLVLLGTGGTIATRATGEGRAVQVGAAELLRAADAVWPRPGVRVEPHDVAGRASFAARPTDVLDLAGRIASAVAVAEGVVVAHGTDTLEESAFLVSLTHSSPVPVVFTGAQRPFDDPAPDGPRNLAAALRWAASPQSRGTGVTLAFADQILPVVGARKTHTLALRAFAAPGRGPVGQVDEAGVRALATVRPAPPLLAPGVRDLPRVEIVGQYLGADAAAFTDARSRGVRGVVVAAFGSGNTTPEATRACLRLLSDGVPVVVTSRVGEGPVVGLYAGGGADLAAAGAVFAGDLSPWQARLLLACVLAGTTPGDLDAVRDRCLDWLRETGTVSSPDPTSPPRKDPTR